jgi:hypothetical protein
VRGREGSEGEQRELKEKENMKRESKAKDHV